MTETAKAEQVSGDRPARGRAALCTEAIGLLWRLVRLQADDGLEYDADGQSYCLFCFADPAGEHEPDCLYRAAVNLLRKVEAL